MLAALAFLTPFGGARRPDARTLRWFPAVGAGIGALVGLVWWGSAKAWPGPLVPAALAVGADLLVTGLLHIDGLADSADGLLPHLTRERRLVVMAQPDVGAFGLAVTAGVLLIRFAALAALRPEVALVAGTWCLSRSVMVASTAVLPYARPGGGLASAFLGGSRTALLAVAAGGTAVGFALVLWGRGGAGVGGAAAGLLVAAGVSWLAYRRLGGFTGDVLGAVAVLTETTVLVVAAARW